MVSMTSALALLFCLLVRASEGVRVQAPSWVPKKEVEKLTKLLQSDSRFKEIFALMKRDGSGFGQQPYFSYLEAVLAAGSRTIFLPTNTAYNKLSPAIKTKLKFGNFIKLQGALQFLTIKAKLANSQLITLRKGASLATANGALLTKLDEKYNPRSIVLGAVGSSQKANVILTDYLSTAALSVHGIDTFLIPPNW